MPRLEPAKSPRNKMRCRIIMSRIDFEQFVRDFSKRIMVDAFGVSVGGGHAAGKYESSGPYDRDPTPRLRALASLHSSRRSSRPEEVFPDWLNGGLSHKENIFLVNRHGFGYLRSAVTATRSHDVSQRRQPIRGKGGVVRIIPANRGPWGPQ